MILFIPTESICVLNCRVQWAFAIETVNAREFDTLPYVACFVPVTFFLPYMITEEASRHCAHTHTQQLFHQQFAFFLRKKVGMKSLHDYKQVHDAKPLLIFTTLEPRYGIRILTVSVSDASIGRAKANNFSPPFGELSHCVCTMNIHIGLSVINIVGLIE